MSTALNQYIVVILESTSINAFCFKTNHLCFFKFGEKETVRRASLLAVAKIHVSIQINNLTKKQLQEKILKQTLQADKIYYKKSINYKNVVSD